MDGFTGAISGAMSASGLGRGTQAIVNAAVSGFTEGYRSYKETGKVDVGRVAIAITTSVAVSMVGGDGFTKEAKIKKYVDQVNKNIHCIGRSSGVRQTIKTGLKMIKKAITKSALRFGGGVAVDLGSKLLDYNSRRLMEEK